MAGMERALPARIAEEKSLQLHSCFFDPIVRQISLSSIELHSETQGAWVSSRRKLCSSALAAGGRSETATLDLSVNRSPSHQFGSCYMTTKSAVLQHAAQEARWSRMAQDAMSTSVRFASPICRSRSESRTLLAIHKRETQNVRCETQIVWNWRRSEKPPLRPIPNSKETMTKQKALNSDEA
jgi:hypothetical protein